MTADPAAAAFGAALAADAGRGSPGTGAAVATPPPRVADRNLEAPYGRDENGNPVAPYGLKADGKTPRLKPGRPSQGKADAPRVVSAMPAAAPAAPAMGQAVAGPDYTDALTDLGIAVWLGLSAMRGGKLGPIRLPDTRPYAAVWHAELGHQVAAWNRAAQQSGTVRAYVEQFTGEGSRTWMIGVGIAAAGLVGACVELHRSDPAIHAKFAAANDRQLKLFMGSEAGLEKADAA